VNVRIQLGVNNIRTACQYCMVCSDYRSTNTLFKPRSRVQLEKL